LPGSDPVPRDALAVELGRGTPRQPGVSSPREEVLTLQEAAALLRVEPGDVETAIEKGELPARRLGQQWRLSRTAVLAWLQGRG
jgi:excisionase family DNA binding protein